MRTPPPSNRGGNTSGDRLHRTTSWSGQRRSFPKPTRDRIMARDQYRCRIGGPNCIGAATEADHILAWSQGGTDDEANGQAVCKPCHDDKTASERRFGMKRHSKYREPPPHPGLNPPPRGT